MKMIVLALMLVGCGGPGMNYIETCEYSKEKSVDPEKGWTEEWKASYKVEWD